MNMKIFKSIFNLSKFTWLLDLQNFEEFIYWSDIFYAYILEMPVINYVGWYEKITICIYFVKGISSIFFKLLIKHKY